ncbi:MAG: TetR/AcrR family transcriptional regulator [Pseudomonadota bacterium]
MENPKSTSESSKSRILDVAEDLFAEHGFDGAGMKAISVRAGVAQGLLHYHFRDKAGLYAAVVARRSALINSARHLALAKVDIGAPGDLEAVLHALLWPPMSDMGGGTAYARIFGSLAVGNSRDVELVRENYDDTATAFIGAIQDALPGIGAANAAWGYSFAIGSLVTILGRTGRSERLAGQDGAVEEMEAVLERLIRFVAAGLRHLRTEDRT